MNFFETPLRRKILFACLYLSEGAPIGFIWLALPTRLRTDGVPIEDITGLTALLVLPWTFKFAWAPLVDLFRSRSWTLRHWIVTAQCVMGLTLAPLIWLDAKQHFSALAALLFVHALSAATQDVAIDALCISATKPGERGQYNGWMQAGMLLGRALMGGGALVMSQYIGNHAVVGLLVLLTMFSTVLVLMSPPPQLAGIEHRDEQHWVCVRQAFRLALRDRHVWMGLLFAATGGAAFKSLDVIYGPFLVDRGYTEEAIGWFSMGPMIGATVVGSILGGWLTDRMGPRRCVAAALTFIAVSIIALALGDALAGEVPGWHLLVCLTTTAFGVGVLIASSYAMFMNLTRPVIAATQFSAFMGATNGCESWSTFVAGLIIVESGYSWAMLAMTAASLLALPLILALRPSEQIDPAVQVDLPA